MNLELAIIGLQHNFGTFVSLPWLRPLTDNFYCLQVFRFSERNNSCFVWCGHKSTQISVLHSVAAAFGSNSFSYFFLHLMHNILVLVCQRFVMTQTIRKVGSLSHTRNTNANANTRVNLAYKRMHKHWSKEREFYHGVVETILKKTFTSPVHRSTLRLRLSSQSWCSLSSTSLRAWKIH